MMNGICGGILDARAGLDTRPFLPRARPLLEAPPLSPGTGAGPGRSLPRGAPGASVPPAETNPGPPPTARMPATHPSHPPSTTRVAPTRIFHEMRRSKRSIRFRLVTRSEEHTSELQSLAYL